MFGDRRLGGDDQTRDRRGVLEGRADDLGRIDNAEFDQVAKFTGLGIVAVVIFLGFEQLATAPSAPALSTIWRAGAWIALRTMSTPVF
jgi:hypothetical protein